MDTPFKWTPDIKLAWVEFRFNYLASLNATSFQCFYCDKQLSEGSDVGQSFRVTLDHVTPISKGGGLFDPSNLEVCCFSCNHSKGNLSLEEFIPYILKKRKSDKKFVKFFTEKFVKEQIT